MMSKLIPRQRAQLCTGHCRILRTGSPGGILQATSWDEQIASEHIEVLRDIDGCYSWANTGLRQSQLGVTVGK